jgi:hypothetical protein
MPTSKACKAIQDHELIAPVGLFYGSVIEEVKKALRYAMEL